jgi:hypothetical protein
MSATHVDESAPTNVDDPGETIDAAAPRPDPELVICPACRAGSHDRCRNGDSQQRSWCDCQHRSPRPTEPATGRPGE